MSFAKIVVATAGVVGVPLIWLWRVGRHHRRSWVDYPTIRVLDAEEQADRRTAVIVLTGAFNGPVSTQRIADEFCRTVGDVFVVDYPEQRFDLEKTVLATYGCVAGPRYDRVIVVGFSLGGLVALHLLRYIQCHDKELASKLSLIVADAPLYPEHLRIPGGAAIPPKLLRLWRKAAPLVRHIKLGPLTNRLSRPVMRASFELMPESTHNPGLDREQLDAHMEFLWGNQLSLAVNQVAAIASSERINPGMVASARVVYVQCGDGTLTDDDPDTPDKVIMANEAHWGWRSLFPGMQSVHVGEETMHINLVESWRSWQEALHRAIRLLQLDKERV